MSRTTSAALLACAIATTIPEVAAWSKGDRPKAGNWQGSPSVSFEVTAEGSIRNFRLDRRTAGIACPIAINEFPVARDGTFLAAQYLPEEDYWLPKDLSSDERKAKKAALPYWPDTITRDNKVMVEVVRITGRFQNGNVVGKFRVLACGDKQFFDKKELYDAMETWDASWKGNTVQDSGAHSKGKAFQVGELVQSGVYGIKVTKATAQNQFKDQYGTIAPSQASQKLLVLEVRFYENGEPLRGSPKEQLHKLSISDARGQTFPTPLTESNEVIFRYILHGAKPIRHSRRTASYTNFSSRCQRTVLDSSCNIGIFHKSF